MKEIEKNILEIELKLKNNIENEIQNSENSETKIKNVIYVGEIEWKDRISNKNISEKLYIVKKEIVLKNQEGKEIGIKEINNYYLGNKCIGGFLDVKEPIFNQYIETAEPQKIESIKNLLEKISIQELGEKSLENLQNKYIDELAQKIGIDKKEILQIDEIDLDENIRNR